MIARGMRRLKRLATTLLWLPIIDVIIRWIDALEERREREWDEPR